jgi:Family of unknown function (DUF5336)
MTNTTGHLAYGAPLDLSGWPPARPNSPKARPNWITRSLWAAVSVLGATTFAVSLAAPILLGYPVRLSVLAATVAAVGLLPSQITRGWIVVGFAVTGCLDALTVLLKADGASWEIAVIVALNSVQSVAAVGALLRESRGPGSAESERISDQSAYARLAEAYQAYATLYQQLFSPSENAAGQAAAQAQSEATTVARADTAQDAFAALQARYARHGMSAAAQQSRGPAEPPAAARMADSGVPGANRVVPESHPDRLRHPDAGGSGVEQTGL